ncbi:MAG: type II toxin-antitoxin system HicA family toxin [Candidatus Gracilibacteria bacterium]
MAEIDKRLARFCNKRGDASFREAIQVLKILNFQIKRMKGSHFFFQKGEGKEAKNITIPVHSGIVKKAYVKDIIKIIKQEENERI